MSAALAFPGPGWRDQWGNSWDQLVRKIQCGIKQAEPAPYLYDPAVEVPRAVAAAAKDLEHAREKKLRCPPVEVPGWGSAFEWLWEHDQRELERLLRPEAGETPVKYVERVRSTVRDIFQPRVMATAAGD